MSLDTTGAPTGRPQTRGRRLLDAALGRLMKLTRADGPCMVTRDLQIPTRDGVVLRADHLAPSGAARGTILVRSPYGFDAVSEALRGSLFAARGYHVVLARVRGTFGSRGGFEPMVHEVDDGADTVAWLREQPWFEGRFATLGGSYLGFTQWALLMDPPPELVAAVVQVGPHDFRRAMYTGGAFQLSDLLGWSDLVAHQELYSPARAQLRMATAGRRHAPALHHLPLREAADRLCEGRAPWFGPFVDHRDADDPFWHRMRLGAALDHAHVPVLLQSGWQDLFLDQTLEQYARLREHGRDVALTVGPWRHIDLGTRAAGTVTREALDWLAEHLAGTGTRMRATPVRVFVPGAGEWRDLAAWPPAGSERNLFPQPGGGLAEHSAPAGTAPAEFTYDPADPTPTIGGRLLAPALAGHKDDSALAERSDVLVFTGPVLGATVEVLGTPVVELAHRSDNPHADLFVRISEVDPKGRSRNVTDGFRRLDPAADDLVRLELDPVAHRFSAGSRVRLLVAGGSFPHWERNLGTDEHPGTGTAMAASHRTIDLTASRVRLPVIP